jgi:NAD(P)-dependent dehydrogenase (short-subunit alcohol dehydrogenase family)
MPRPTDMRRRVALVTGSGRGLGRAYASALARDGHAVVVNSPPRPEGASADAVARELRAAGGEVVAHIGSVADEAGGQAAVDAAVAAFGKLDVLVCNAGVIVNQPFTETSVADLDAMLGVHLRGPFAAVRHAYHGMRERGFGRIVLTGSGSAAFGLQGQAAYASAKGAITALCRVLGLEGGDEDVLVNVVLPVAPPAGRTPATAWIRSLYGERADRLDPEWVAPLVCLLAGDSCPGSGGVYSAVAGRYARVVTAVGPGWQAEGPEPPSTAELAANAAAIADATPHFTPGSILEEIEAAARALNASTGCGEIEMSDARENALVEIEAIKRLKARYFRLVDTKRWDEWGDVFTENAVLDHPANRPEPIVGRAEIVETVSASLRDVITVHHGHMPEIELLDATHASGVWAMEDLLLTPDGGSNSVVRYHGYGHYIERYVKGDDGRWRIAHLLLSRLHLETERHVRLIDPALASIDQSS